MQMVCGKGHVLKPKKGDGGLTYCPRCKLYWLTPFSIVERKPTRKKKKVEK